MSDVLLLRDVLDYSVREAALALDVSEPDIKTTLHRARKAMAAYDASRVSHDLTALGHDVLMRFVAALAAEDVAAVEALLSDDVRALSDGGGVYFAARKPVVGRSKVARFYLNISGKRPVSHIELRTLNGAPTLVASFFAAESGQAPHVTVACELDADGRIRTIWSILVDDKIAHLLPSGRLDQAP